MGFPGFAGLSPSYMVVTLFTWVSLSLAKSVVPAFGAADPIRGINTQPNHATE